MNKIVLYIVIALLLIGLGFGIATWRTRNRIAQYDERERKRMEKIAANEAEQNKLRGENEALRKSIAQLEAREATIQQIIDERGGSIEQKYKDIAKIEEKLKSDVEAINANTDRCVTCCSYSTEALRLKLISKPLNCNENCSGQPCPAGR